MTGLNVGRRLYLGVVDLCFVAGLLTVLGDAFASTMLAGTSITQALILLLSGLLSIAGLYVALQRGLPMQSASFVFWLFFMAVAPLYQIGVHSDPIFAEDRLLLTTSLGSLAFAMIGVLVLLSTGAEAGSLRAHVAPTFTRAAWVSVFVLAMICEAAAFALFGSALLTSRNAFAALLASRYDPAIAVLVALFTMDLAFYASVVGLAFAMRAASPGVAGLFLASLAASCLLNNVFITARFKLAALAMFALQYLWGLRPRLQTVVLIFGLASASLFQIFRSDEAYDGGADVSGVNPFLGMDFDAFSSFCYAVEAVLQNGVTWGDNLLGAILFFVPRTLWPGKPYPSSVPIADIMRGFRFVGTDNLSMPLVAEGYYAFGWLGLLGLSTVFWLLCARMDRDALRSGSGYTFAAVCAAPSFIFLLLRGTLLVGFAYTIGACVAIGLPLLLIRIAQPRAARED